MINDKKKILVKIIFPAVWLVIWQIAAVIIDNPIFIPGPVAVIERLLDFFGESAFYYSVAGSVTRILGGFAIAFLMAYVFAFASFFNSVFYHFCYPLVVTLRSVPVAAVVVIISILAGSSNVTLFVTFMIVFPVVFINVYEGLSKIDNSIIEMADMFKISFYNRYQFIYLPGIKAYVISSVKSGVGLAFKSGVAAEVICQVKDSIGLGVYSNKIYLDTPGVLAWTIVVVLLSFIFEKIIVLITEKSISIAKAKPVVKIMKAGDKSISVNNISKSFEELKLFSHINVELPPSETGIIVSPSGTGKTTLLRILAGLEETDDKKRINLNGRISFLFQENRLLEDYSVRDNLNIVESICNEEDKQSLLAELGLHDVYNKKINELSGGMKRRVALLRTLLYPSEYLLLDEPFAGLDNESINKTVSTILKLKGGRCTIMALHDNSFCDQFEPVIIDINNCE